MSVQLAKDYLSKKNIKGYSEKALKQVGDDLMKFDQYDADKSGCLDKKEVMSMLSKDYLCSEFGHGFATDGDVEAFVKELDDDGNGRVDREEWVQKIILRWANGTYIRQLIKYDTDRNGKISRDQIYEGLTDDGYTKEDLAKFIDDNKLDEAGKVDFKLFIRTFFDVNRK